MFMEQNQPKPTPSVVTKKWYERDAGKPFLILLGIFILVVIVKASTTPETRTTTKPTTEKIVVTNVQAIQSTNTPIPTRPPMFTTKTIFGTLEGYKFEKKEDDGKVYFVASNPDRKGLIVKAWGNEEDFNSVEVNLILMKGIDLNDTMLEESIILLNLAGNKEQMEWMAESKNAIGEKKYIEKRFADRKMSMIIENQEMQGTKYSIIHTTVERL